MRITLLQYAPVWEDHAASREKISRLLDGHEPSDWLVLPEMAFSGFSMDSVKTTWTTEDYEFCESLVRARKCWLTVGGVEDGRNVAFVFSPEGEIAARYAKRHLFSFAEEDSHYVAGNASATYAINGLEISQAICYDLRFPYHFWGSASSCHAYCVIAAWGAKRAAHWKTLLRARAIENQAFVIGVNRVGNEPNVSYSGDSAIIGPLGETILDCEAREGAFSAEIDLATLTDWRKVFPVLKDRRE